VGGAGGCVVHNEHVFLQFERMSTTCVSCRPMCPSILQDMPATERRTETSWHEKEDSWRISWSWQLAGALTPEVDAEAREKCDKELPVGFMLGFTRLVDGELVGFFDGNVNRGGALVTPLAYGNDISVLLSKAAPKSDGSERRF